MLRRQKNDLVPREHVEMLLREKDRQIQILAEQIEWLRGQIGTRVITSATEVLNPSEQPPMVSTFSPWVGEEEEDLRALAKAGHITDADLAQALEHIGFLNNQIERAD